MNKKSYMCIAGFSASIFLTQTAFAETKTFTCEHKSDSSASVDSVYKVTIDSQDKVVVSFVSGVPDTTAYPFAHPFSADSSFELPCRTSENGELGCGVATKPFGTMLAYSAVGFSITSDAQVKLNFRERGLFSSEHTYVCSEAAH